MEVCPAVPSIMDDGPASRTTHLCPLRLRCCCLLSLLLARCVTNSGAVCATAAAQGVGPARWALPAFRVPAGLQACVDTRPGTRHSTSPWAPPPARHVLARCHACSGQTRRVLAGRVALWHTEWRAQRLFDTRRR